MCIRDSTNTSSTDSIPAFSPVTILNNDGDVSPTPPAYGVDNVRIIHGITIAAIPASSTGMVCVSGKFSINMAQNASRTVGERIFAVGDLDSEGYSTILHFENDELTDTDARVQLVGYLANYTDNATDATYLIRSISGGNVGSATLVHLSDDQGGGGAVGNQEDFDVGGGYRWSASSFRARMIDDFTLTGEEDNFGNGSLLAYTRIGTRLDYDSTEDLPGSFTEQLISEVTANPRMFESSWTASPELPDDEGVIFFCDSVFRGISLNAFGGFGIAVTPFFRIGDSSDSVDQGFGSIANFTETATDGELTDTIYGLPNTFYFMGMYKNTTGSSLSTIPFNHQSLSTGSSILFGLSSYYTVVPGDVYCFRVSDVIT